MKKRYAYLEVDWEVMDIRKMSLGENSIDVAIDKVGLQYPYPDDRSEAHLWQSTLDAMVHGSLWDPEEDVKENVGLYVNQVRFHHHFNRCFPPS